MLVVTDHGTIISAKIVAQGSLRKIHLLLTPAVEDPEIIKSRPGLVEHLHVRVGVVLGLGKARQETFGLASHLSVDLCRGLAHRASSSGRVDAWVKK